MGHQNQHINPQHEFFGKLNVPYSKSKEEIWLQMEPQLSKTPQSKIRNVVFRKTMVYGAAAMLILAIGLTAFFRFYTIEVLCPKAMHQVVMLPDGSKTTLNADTFIKYRPYWWRFNREVQLAGEAFFEVTKGSKFEVVSEKASTTVLGTSFNIYARNHEYKVHCLTGKVSVKSSSNSEIVLLPNEFGVLDQENKVTKFKSQNTEVVAWINHELVFTSMPLKQIFEEIERQYNIEIVGKENVKGVASFNAKGGKPALDVIMLIGKPFGIECRKISDKKYVIEQK